MHQSSVGIHGTVHKTLGESLWSVGSLLQLCQNNLDCRIYKLQYPQKTMFAGVDSKDTVNSLIKEKFRENQLEKLVPFTSLLVLSETEKS